MSYINWNSNDTLATNMIRHYSEITVWRDKRQNSFTLQNDVFKIKLKKYYDQVTSQRLNLTHGWKLTSSKSLGFMNDNVRSGIPLNLTQQSIYNKLKLYLI